MYLKKQDEVPYSPQILSEYLYLAGRANSGSSEYPLPYIGELIEETWQSIAQEVLVNEIQAAITRNDHEEIYGMDKRNFTKSAMAGSIRGFEVPHIKIMEIRDYILLYLRSRSVSFMDYEGKVIHSPVGRGVW